MKWATGKWDEQLISERDTHKGLALHIDQKSTAGMYRLQQPDESFVYAENVEIRVFVQRFMYKRYNAEDKSYVKTLMAEDLNGDLKIFPL